MSNEAWGLIGTIVGGVLAIVGGGLTIFGNWLMDDRKYKREQQHIWRERCYETLRQVLILFDKIILFSGNSDKPINQLEEIDAEDHSCEEWNEICSLRCNIMADILVHFDCKTLEEFNEVFQSVWEGGYTTSQGDKKLNYQDISDEVGAFVERVKKRYSMDFGKEE